MNFLSIRSFRNLAAALALTLTAAVPAMHAQSTPDIAQFNAPFAFEAGSAHYPAGRYMLSIPRGGGLILQVRGASKSGFTMSHGEIDNKPNPKSVVVFHKYGDKYFLAEVRTKGSANYIECAESSEESKTRKTELALNRTKGGVQMASVEATR